MILLLELVPLSLWVNLKFPDTPISLVAISRLGIGKYSGHCSPDFAGISARNAVWFGHNTCQARFSAGNRCDNYSGDRLGRQPLYTFLNRSGDLGERVLDIDGGFNNWFYLAMMAQHPSLIGHTPDAPPIVAGAIGDLFNRLTNDASNRRLDPAAAGLLYQLNIGYVISSSEVKLEGLDEVIQNEDAVLWYVPHHSSVIATTVPEGGNRIPIEAPRNGDVEVAVYQHNMTATRVFIRFSLSSPAFVQAAYTACPYQKALLDGQHITLISTALGLIGFWADEGEHTLAITPELSPLRQWTLAVNAITALVLILMVVLPIRRTE